MVPVKEQGRERTGKMARGTGLPCEDPHRNNNGGATSHPGLIPSRGRPRALTCRPDQSQTCGRTGQKGAVARSRPSGIWFCWKPLGGRQCPQGHVPGSGRTGPRSHGRHLRVAGLAQSARASAMGQHATQHGGAPGGPPDPPGWRPAAGDQLALPALAPPETAVDREEHSGEHSGGGLKRRTQEEHSQGHSGGALRRGTQEGAPSPPQPRSPGLSEPHRLQVSLTAWPRSIDRQMDRACLALPGGPVIPLHNRDRLHHLSAWPAREPAFPRLSRLPPRLEGQRGRGLRRPSCQEHGPEMSQPLLWPHSACGHCLLLHCCPASPRSNPRVSEQRRACARGGLSSPGRN